MVRKRIVIGLAALSVMLVSSLASAQGAKKADAKEKKDESGYGYEFSDDPLSAGGFGPNDATIRVRPGAVRTTLIRPRTSFVPEMLKSVENLLGSHAPSSPPTRAHWNVAASLFESAERQVALAPRDDSVTFGLHAGRFKWKPRPRLR